MGSPKNVCIGGYCNQDFTIQNIECFYGGGGKRDGVKLGIAVHE